jgi:hypothetical protein
MGEAFTEKAMRIVNLTLAPTTAEQAAAGVVDPPEEAAEALRALLVFEEIPSADEIRARAGRIADFAVHYSFGSAMLGGDAPWLWAPLEIELLSFGIQPLFAFQKRENGQLRHAGFVESAAE